jgi:hypothetical protein
MFSALELPAELQLMIAFHFQILSQKEEWVSRTQHQPRKSLPHLARLLKKEQRMTVDGLLRVHKT